MATTKKAQRDILKDVRRQLQVIEMAINEKNQILIDELANQLSATAASLNSENMGDE